mmetsp:Transcript_20374/g.59512  ORF Transcript_20374/g.59512 Transcript_20374/m.59512 type:complete len:207 (-) Transcript_20374:1713-2333(-)
MGLVEFGNELFSVARCHASIAFRVHHGQETKRPLHKQLNARVVVREHGLVPLDLLLRVLFGLGAEDDVVEELLKRLVGGIDEQLLEPVAFHVFKAEDVEDANEKWVRRGIQIQGMIHVAHHPVEEAAVDRLGQGISKGRGLVGVVVLGHRLPPREFSHAHAETATNGGHVEPKELARRSECRLGGWIHNALLAFHASFVIKKLDIA